MSTGYAWEGGSIIGPSGPILTDLNLSFPDRAVTMLVGPGGTGKTSMLRALSGEPQPEGVTYEGSLSLRGVARKEWDSKSILFVPQQRTGDELARIKSLSSRVYSVLLLDEPGGTRLDAAVFADIHELLTVQRMRGLSLVVTHNLDLIRHCADYVCLVCAGRMDCFSDSRTFLSAPPTPLAAQFVKQGNCWPKKVLPKHFHWVRPGLAGMGRPGLLGDIETDLAALASEGVDTLVSLTEKRIPLERLRAHGITGKHLPIVDMSVPSINAAATVCADTARALNSGSRVAFHCEAGLGRTGTMLASYLAFTGVAPAAAIDEVRTRIRGAIQTDSQVSFVHRFAEAFGGRPC